MPFGSAVLFDEDRGKLVENWRKDRETKPNMMDNQESIFVQYMNLQVFSDALYVCSAWTSGLGQVTFGSDSRRKADCLFAAEEERIERGRVVETRRVLRYFNFHGLAFHGTGFHLEDCPKTQTLDGRMAPPKSGLWMHGEVKIRDDQDELKQLYAEALTRVNPSSLAVRYNVAHECDFFCKSVLPDPGGLRAVSEQDSRSGWRTRHDYKGKVGLDRKYSSIREFLKKEFPVDSVLGAEKTEYTQESLVEEIVKSGYNSVAGNGFGGFVTITGGRETRSDDGTILRQFGMCHQRCNRRAEEVGAFSRFQAHRQHGCKEDGEKWLERLLKAKSTMSRNSFHEEGETISLDYFRFLLNERDLRGFKIRHFISYQHRHFLTPFIQDMLQKRHETRSKPGGELMSQVLKLVLNGLYGERDCQKKASATIPFF